MTYDPAVGVGFSRQGFEVQKLFPTPFIVAPVDKPEALNAALKAAILAARAATPGVQKSNDGGWQSNDDFHLTGGKAVADLIEAARHLADTQTAVQTPQGLQAGGPAWKVNAWANVNQDGHANTPHYHPAAFWSGVYWVDDGAPDEGGEFEMTDPRGVMPAMYAPAVKYAIPGCLSAGWTDFFTPKTGVLVLMPSWLVHSVRRYRGGGARISIAFNLSV